MKFELTILGSNSAIPAYDRFPTSQVLNIHEKLYLVDCGEGTQMRMNQFKIKRSKIDQIFISHLHGDHVFGLVGLLTSYSLLKRTKQLQVFGPKGLKEMIENQLSYTGIELYYTLEFNVIEPTHKELIFDDERVEVFAFPLLHRIPTTGYLFTEKPLKRKFIKQKRKEYEIPVENIRLIKEGEDFIFKGKRIPNSELTMDPDPPRSYAYCSDTAFDEKIIQYISGANVLYHETTFLSDKEAFARETFHSTARQAAMIAKKADVGLLVTGHYSSRYRDLDPILEEAKSVFPNVILGLDGLTYLIS